MICDWGAVVLLCFQFCHLLSNLFTERKRASDLMTKKVAGSCIHLKEEFQFSLSISLHCQDACYWIDLLLQVYIIALSLHPVHPHPFHRSTNSTSQFWISLAHAKRSQTKWSQPGLQVVWRIEGYSVSSPGKTVGWFLYAGLCFGITEQLNQAIRSDFMHNCTLVEMEMSVWLMRSNLKGIHVDTVSWIITLSRYAR